MPREIRPLFPRAQQRIEGLGDRLRAARLRRGTSLSEMATRVGVSRMTLRALEKGEPSVSLSLLIRVLSVLGLDSDIDRIASEDEVGHRLADARSLPQRRQLRRGPGE